jgi:hypothetical protein
LSTEIRSELIDELMDRYIDWREECLAVQAAYEHWATGLEEERESAFGGYQAALDREEQASAIFAERIDSINDEQREPASAPPAVLGGIGGRVVTSVGALLPRASRSERDTRQEKG